MPVHRESLDPSTGKSLGHVSAAGIDDVDRAVDAATKAFKDVWGLKTPGHERGRLLLELARAIETNADALGVGYTEPDETFKGIYTYDSF